jgi:hypothetical protein
MFCMRGGTAVLTNEIPVPNRSGASYEMSPQRVVDVFNKCYGTVWTKEECLGIGLRRVPL